MQKVGRVTILDFWSVSVIMMLSAKEDNATKPPWHWFCDFCYRGAYCDVFVKVPIENKGLSRKITIPGTQFKYQFEMKYIRFGPDDMRVSPTLFRLSDATFDEIETLTPSQRKEYENNLLLSWSFKKVNAQIITMDQLRAIELDGPEETKYVELSLHANYENSAQLTIKLNSCGYLRQLHQYVGKDALTVIRDYYGDGGDPSHTLQEAMKRVDICACARDGNVEAVSQILCRPTKDRKLQSALSIALQNHDPALLTLLVKSIGTSNAIDVWKYGDSADNMHSKNDHLCMALVPWNKKLNTWSAEWTPFSVHCFIIMLGGAGLQILDEKSSAMQEPDFGQFMTKGEWVSYLMRYNLSKQGKKEDCKARAVQHMLNENASLRQRLQPSHFCALQKFVANSKLDTSRDLSYVIRYGTRFNGVTPEEAALKMKRAYAIAHKLSYFLLQFYDSLNHSDNAFASFLKENANGVKNNCFSIAVAAASRNKYSLSMNILSSDYKMVCPLSIISSSYSGHTGFLTQIRQLCDVRNYFQGTSAFIHEYLNLTDIMKPWRKSTIRTVLPSLPCWHRAGEVHTICPITPFEIAAAKGNYKWLHTALTLWEKLMDSCHPIEHNHIAAHMCNNLDNALVLSIMNKAWMLSDEKKAQETNCHDIYIRLLRFYQQRPYIPPPKQSLSVALLFRDATAATVLIKDLGVKPVDSVHKACPLADTMTAADQDRFDQCILLHHNIIPRLGVWPKNSDKNSDNILWVQDEGSLQYLVAKRSLVTEPRNLPATKKKRLH